MAEVVAALRRALKHDPLARRPAGMLAMTLFLLGEEVAARERIAIGELTFPRDPSFRVLRMLLETRSGNVGAADREAQWLERKSGLGKGEVAAAFALRGITQQYIYLEPQFAGDGTKPVFVIMANLLIYQQQLQVQLANGGGIALPLPPLYLQTWNQKQLLQIMFALGPFSDARKREAAHEALTRMIRAHPDALLFLYQGLLLFRMHRYADAEKAFLAAAEAQSLMHLRAPALNGMVGCRLLRALDDGKGADVKLNMKIREDIRGLVTVDNVSPDYAEGFAEFARRMGDIDLARQVVVNWERRAPNDKRVRFYRARVEFDTRAYGRVLEIAQGFKEGDPLFKEMMHLKKDARAALVKEAQALQKAP
jgi:hypothetical protein